jgi:hypothetical protein
MVSLEAGGETGVAAALSLCGPALEATGGTEATSGWTVGGVVELSRAGFVREPSSVAPGVAAAVT